MGEPKTRLMRASAGRFLNSIEEPRRRADCRTIAVIMKQATRSSPKMWGLGIVGSGTSTIKYAGGRESERVRIAFEPRKDKLTLCVNSAFTGYRGLRAKLGKTSGGAACIHIKALTDVHLPTLRKLVAQSVRHSD